MGKIMSIITEMGVYCTFFEHTPLLKSKVYVECDACNKKVTTTADAVYRQHRRGRDKYVCKSCSGKKGWTQSKKNEARGRSLKNWGQPNYAGTIVGKAMARQIIKETE